MILNENQSNRLMQFIITNINETSDTEDLHKLIYQVQDCNILDIELFEDTFSDFIEHQARWESTETIANYFKDQNNKITVYIDRIIKLSNEISLYKVITRTSYDHNEHTENTTIIFTDNSDTTKEKTATAKKSELTDEQQKKYMLDYLQNQHYIDEDDTAELLEILNNTGISDKFINKFTESFWDYYYYFDYSENYNSYEIEIISHHLTINIDEIYKLDKHIKFIVNTDICTGYDDFVQYEYFEITED